MRKYFRKFSTISSTAKLFFFIALLFAVVVLASSGFYIQYKNKQKPGISESAATTQANAAPKSTLSNLSNLSNDLSQSNSGHSEGQAANQASSASISSQATNTTAPCARQTLKHATVQKTAPWLPQNDTRIIPGRDGYAESCPGKRTVTQDPVDQIIYTGTKPLHEVTSLLDSVVDGIKDIKIL